MVIYEMGGMTTMESYGFRDLKLVNEIVINSFHLSYNYMYLYVIK